MRTAATAIQKALNAFGESGGFLSRRTAPADDLKLEVKGLGPIRFPITDLVAQKLCLLGEPAKHGYKDKTRLDRRVRDTWEISPRRITINESRWQKTLAPMLARIHKDLGLPEGCTLKAQLHNLLVYAPQQFFKPHQDTEKGDGMIGTLVISLPSRFKGGEMVIEHQGRKETVKSSGKDLGFVAFYADSHHEVRRVTAGYRVVLTYNLMLQGRPRPQKLPEPALEVLAQKVRRFFEAPTSPALSEGPAGPPPDRLVYLLDHEYSAHSLQWDRLKGSDATTAAALREVAERLDCKVYLALADIHESWECVDEYEGHHRRSRYWEDDSDEDEEIDTPSEPTVTDLLDSEIGLRHFVGEGRPQSAFTGGVDDDELCYKTPTSDLKPFKSEHEGYMGNWGNTVDYWYHRAAVVLWPRSRAFVMQAKESPLWAVEEIGRKLDSAKGASEALPLARSLLGFWGQRYWRDKDSALATVASVAARLGDPDVAAALLRPFSLFDVKARAVPAVVGLLDTYGRAWFQALLRSWEEATEKWRMPDEKADWQASVLPSLCRALCKREAGTAFARQILATQWRLIRTTQMGPWNEDLSEEVRGTEAVYGKSFVALLAAAQVVGDKDIPRQILALLTHKDEDLVPMQLAVLRAGSASKDLPLAVLAPVHARALRTLAEQLDSPRRAPNDWSITVSLDEIRGYGPDGVYRQLQRFLAAKDQKRMEWPLAGEERSVVTGAIERGKLPVSHSLKKTSRPFILVLEKTAELFKRETAERSAREKDLQWLKSIEKEMTRAS